MKRAFCLALICAGVVEAASLARVDAGEPRDKHHRLGDWLSLISGEQRTRLRKAKEEALKDPVVQAAKQRHQEAEAEYRVLLQKEMLKTDPSLKPLLDTIAELRQHDVY